MRILIGLLHALQEISGWGSILADVKILASNSKGESIVKRFLTAIALACIVSCTAFAGDIPSGGYAPPTGDELAQTPIILSPGDSPTGGYTEDWVPDSTLSVLQTVIDLLSV